MNTVFKNSEYDKIQKVYSIWICTTPPEELENTISHYYMTRRTLLGSVKESQKAKDLYHIPNVIIVNLGDSDTKDCDGIIRMLYTLLVSDQTAQEKKNIAHNEYGIPITEEFDEKVDNMCNISTMYVERGIKQGIEQGMEKGFEKGFEQGFEQGRLELLRDLVKQQLLSIEQAAAQLNLSVMEFKKIAKLS